MAVDLLQKGVIALVGNDDEAGHASPDQLAHGTAFDLRVLVGGAQEDCVACVGRHLDRRLGQRRVERVGQVAEQQADGHRVLPGTQRTRDLVALVSDLADRRVHTLGRLLTDRPDAVDDAGHGDKGDSGPLCDIAHRRPGVLALRETTAHVGRRPTFLMCFAATCEGAARA